ncbi:MAG: hypothetical protein IT290_03175 [Deltaproteobacteria bacterium]|nr:hypothetical protein [Deltaproteobacteria bacterium]
MAIANEGQGRPLFDRERVRGQAVLMLVEKFPELAGRSIEDTTRLKADLGLKPNPEDQYFCSLEASFGLLRGAIGTPRTIGEMLDAIAEELEKQQHRQSANV